MRDWPPTATAEPIFAFAVVTPFSSEEPKNPKYRSLLVTGCQPEVQMDSKWELFASPNRFRTMDLLVNNEGA